MSFQPVLPLRGYAGWQFLQRTLPQQQEAFSKSAEVKRATDYFREKITSVRTAEDLVGDRRLLQVALGAFGLDEDIDSRFFIRKVLEDGTVKSDALANKLADKRYQNFSRTFGFGDLGGLTLTTGFADKIIGRYEARQFERAVGDQDDSMRLALNLSHGLSEILANTEGTDNRWFGVMGNPPLRAVFETALGFGEGFGRIDIDLQLVQFKDRAVSTFGTDKLADFAKPEMQEKLIRLYLVRNEVRQSSAAGAQAIALSLLQQVPNPWKQSR